MPPFYDELTHFSAVLQKFTTEKRFSNDKLKFLGSRIYLFTLFIRICNPDGLKYEFVTLISDFQPHGSKKEVRISTPHFLTWQ